MKALVMTAYGGNDVVELRDVAAPVPGPGEVLIDVHAAGINPLDFKIRQGALRLLRRFPLPAVMGNELAGVVARTAPDVTSLKPGDEVYARVAKERLGAFAEQAVVAAELCALKPRQASMDEAAAVPLAALTALQALREQLGLAPGQRVLIPAGAGGVGTFAIQLAKLAGARVATTASGKGLDLVRELGADLVIDYKAERLADKVRDLDAVFDTLGGVALEEAFALLKRGGAICSVAGTPEPTTAANMGGGALLRGAFWVASYKLRGLGARHGVRYTYLFMRPDGAQLAELAGLIDAGKLRPVIDRVYPLADAKEALAYVEAGRAKGKVVIKVRGG